MKLLPIPSTGNHKAYYCVYYYYLICCFRHNISEAALAVQNEWKVLVTGLSETKETLATLALQWEDFEQKYKSFDNQLTLYSEQFGHIESTYTSIKQMKLTHKTLSSLLEDVKNMDGRYKDVQILSDNVIR